MKRRWTEKKIAQRVRDGYGQGKLAEYTPWIRIRDLSSQGTSTRMWSPKTGRMMEFLSNIERDTFLVAEFREDFIDYWEQFPLDRSWTQWAAEALRKRHPIYIGSTIPVVMTVDGLLSQRCDEEGVRYTVLDCKHSDSLKDARVMEKLSIARLACERICLPHVLVTETSANKQLVHNILWVRAAVPKAGEKVPVAGAFDIWPMRLHSRLLTAQSNRQFRDQTLSEYCRAFGREFELPAGFGLRCMKLLIWQHLVELDMDAAHPELTRVGALRIRPAQKFGAPSSPA